MGFWCSAGIAKMAKEGIFCAGWISAKTRCEIAFQRYVLEIPEPKRTLQLAGLRRSGYHQYMTEGKNPAAVELGRLGGEKGGKARAEKPTPEQREEIARKADKVRWDKKRRAES